MRPGTVRLSRARPPRKPIAVPPRPANSDKMVPIRGHLMESSSVSRRSFLTSSVAGATAFQIIKPELVRGAGNEKLKAGLVGCGGRGTQAMQNILTGSDNVEIVAMADVFEDRLEDSLRKIEGPQAGARRPRQGGRRAPLRRLRRLQESHRVDVDIVMLATYPGYRPMHFEAAVEAKKHIFCEKPLGTDPVEPAPLHGRRQEIRGAEADGEIRRAAALAGLVPRPVQAPEERRDRRHRRT